jgi:hypothetical protein
LSIRILKDMKLRGTIRLLPIANPSAMTARSRFSPLDSRDLNRDFPGDRNGTYSQQLAAALSEHFLGVLGTDHFAPDAAHQPEAITTDALHARLVVVGRAEPAAGGGDDAGRFRQRPAI